MNLPALMEQTLRFDSVCLRLYNISVSYEPIGYGPIGYGVYIAYRIYIYIYRWIWRSYDWSGLRLMRIHGEQVFEDGLFNADPHPGNVMLLPHDSVGLIDFGQVKAGSFSQVCNAPPGRFGPVSGPSRPLNGHVHGIFMAFPLRFVGVVAGLPAHLSEAHHRPEPPGRVRGGALGPRDGQPDSARQTGREALPKGTLKAFLRPYHLHLYLYML